MSSLRQEKIKYLLRWIIVLPGAILGGIIGTFPLLALFIVLPIGMALFKSIDIVNSIAAVLFSFFYVFFGAKLAPKYKIITSIILIILLICTYLVLLNSSRYIFHTTDLLLFLGSLGGLFLVKKVF